MGGSQEDKSGEMLMRYLFTFLAILIFSTARGQSPVFLQQLPEQIHPQLFLSDTLHSLSGYHLRVPQYYRGIPVQDGGWLLHYSHDGKLLKGIDHTLAVSSDASIPSTCENCFWLKANEKEYWLTERKMIRENDRSYFQFVNLHSNETLVREISINKNLLPDSLALISIFLPDPLTSAQQNYGAPYSDQNDTDVPQLLNEIVQVNYPVFFDNDTFRLQNDLVIITDHSSPSVVPAFSLTPNFQFTRSQDGFEDVNVFYHLTEYQLYLRSLGFTTLVNYAIPADAHGLNGADNSNFNPGSTPPRLTFGEGGVDDGEDADVIIHEFSHAISHSAAPLTTTGTERMAIEEGNGDFLAASYSKAIDSYNWEQVYSWDGHNEFWNGRMVQSSKLYPMDLSGNFYQDAEIWSSTLMQIRDAIGKEVSEQILFESMFNYVPNMTMTMAAQLFIQADSLLNGGNHYSPICYYFSTRGIIPNCSVGWDESDHPEEITLTPLGANEYLISGWKENYSIALLNTLGQEINSFRLQPGAGAARLQLFPESGGIYFLRVNGSPSTLTFTIFH